MVAGWFCSCSHLCSLIPLLSGVTNWTARPDVFPDGFGYLTSQLRWPVQGHNRYWDAASTYATANGGSYPFIRDLPSGFALPDSQLFWDDLMRNASLWGLRVYEQDWLNDVSTRPAHSNPQTPPAESPSAELPHADSHTCNLPPDSRPTFRLAGSRRSSNASRRSPNRRRSGGGGSPRWHPAPQRAASPSSIACR